MTELNFDIKEILISIGYRINCETSGFYRMKPIYRNSGNDSVLSVNKKTGWYTDFKTGDSGPLYKLISISKGISLSEAKKIIGEPTDTADKPIQKLSNNDMPILFNKEEIKELLPYYSFYNKKGISKETLEYFQSGYCTYGKMSDRYVFPIFHKSGELRGLAGRDITNKKSIKWKNLGQTKTWDYPYYFNKDFINKEREIILVESIGDMLALWECGIRNVLVCFGTKIGQESLLTVISANPKRVIISMNFDLPDENGNCPGQVAAEKIKTKLNSWFSNGKILVSFPEANDFGSMNQEQILKWRGNL